MSQILALIGTSFNVISAILVAVGWRFVRAGRTNSHRKVMVFAFLFATGFFVIYVTRTLVIGNTPFGGPDELKGYYLIFLFFHIILVTISAVLWVITLYLAFNKKFSLHKRLGPWSAMIWFASVITGVILYIVLYEVYPSGTTTSLIKAILPN
ncbi:DUF420 domain-containing protein [Microaerobacter geothermalis]|uniref:DUF420 domain-containing protein n=1 Tax=Microaerobacter geothermalis TaxID=674972 RepID=UPI0022A66097